MDPGEPDRRKVLRVAQEISLAKILASNDKRTRDRGVRKLGKWLAARARAGLRLSEDDLLRVWKGLFYCMWMADKPLVQEELAEAISRLVHSGGDLDFAVSFTACCLRTMAREWAGIDHLRLDKFLMLVRRVVRQLLGACSREDWAPRSLEAVGAMLEATVLSRGGARSLSAHVCEVLLVELAKASRGHLPEDSLLALLRPFAAFLGRAGDRFLRAHVVDHVFHHLIRQSEFGQDCEARFAAWRAAGFPGSSWEQMARVEVSDDEDEEEEGRDPGSDGEAELDPRAGSVHVDLRPLPFSPEAVAKLLLDRRAATFKLCYRRSLKKLAGDFLLMSAGKYPLSLQGLQGVRRHIAQVRQGFKRERRTAKETKRLMAFEEELRQQTGGKRKSKKRKLKK
ncbi:ribosomal RNA processing protein 1 homolog [Bacillus rossius redtenbacheri]|uniref:ribosomal RNA processing protein 1 homolog n=1 Tax=Bacillus rossius redtenbacheri TaxID=93214 RepID=UPI002FDE26C3